MYFRVCSLLLAAVFVVTFPFCLTAQVQIPEDPEWSDTSLVNALIDSSFEYSFSHPDSAIRFASRAMALARAIEYQTGIANAHRELGYSWGVKGNFEKSLDHYEKGEALYRQTGDTLGLIAQLNDIGNTYMNQSEYDEALEYFFESLSLCESVELDRGISANLGNIGLSYFELGEDEKALEFYNRAVDINKRLGNKRSLSTNYNNLGLLHGDQGRFDRAIEYHKQALELRRELGYTIEIANSLNNIGRLYMQQEKFDQARSYLNRALAVNGDRDMDLASIIHENMAKMYRSAGEVDSALAHAQKTLALSQEYGTKLGKKVGYELLTDIHKSIGNVEKAFNYQQKLMAVKDSILNDEKAKQINELQAKYESEKKDKQIALLEKEKEKQALLQNAFLAGLILVGIIGILVYNHQRLKIRKNRAELKNRQLKEEKLEQDLEFRNKQLTTHTLHLVQKNKTMKKLKENINEIRSKNENNIRRELQKIENLVDYSFQLDEDWEQFRLYFEEVHSGFFDALKERYPDLTPHELRLAALARLNLSVKDIAAIMGITPDSVKTARYRLRKKLGMETEENLTEFMMEMG